MAGAWDKLIRKRARQSGDESQRSYEKRVKHQIRQFANM